MTDADRAALALASRLLEYPDSGYFGGLPTLAMELESLPPASTRACLGFAEKLMAMGEKAAAEQYVMVFDHDPAASLHMAWHRYGNDRGQGKAMAALNGLYRAAGFEPEKGVMPDYLPRILEFLSVCEEWACAVVLDGFGVEMDRLAKRLHELGSPHAPVLETALAPLKRQWPDYFSPRTGPDPTARPMARPEEELEPIELIIQREKRGN